MYCYCIKDSQSDRIYQKIVNKRTLAKDLDKHVIEGCIKDLKKFDRIVTFYGAKFDLPFVRTRATYWQLPFPFYKTLLHTDIYYIVRNKFRIHSNRLETAYNTLVGKSRKTHFGRDYWIRAMQGDKESLSYILDHCRRDVLDLEELYNVIQDFAMKRDLSI